MKKALKIGILVGMSIPDLRINPPHLIFNISYYEIAKMMERSDQALWILVAGSLANLYKIGEASPHNYSLLSLNPLPPLSAEQKEVHKKEDQDPHFQEKTPEELLLKTLKCVVKMLKGEGTCKEKLEKENPFQKTDQMVPAHKRTLEPAKHALEPEPLIKQPETSKPTRPTPLFPEGIKLAPTFMQPPSLEITSKGLDRLAIEPTPIKSPAEASLLLPISHPSNSQQTFPILASLFYPFTAPISASSGSHQAHTGTKSRKKGGKEQELPKEVMSLIPKGPLSWQEDRPPIEIEAFAIAITPVTNFQFAYWLSSCFDAKKIALYGGAVYDLEGSLLCETREKAPNSQIEIVFKEGSLTFKPLSHTEHHPVVHVTYKGALAYCKENGVRLPTENEWERAAAMQPPSAKDPFKKYLFATSSDQLTIQQANFRESFSLFHPLENRTTPVGFYNGETLFAKKYQTLQTKLAQSPFGCFDMSGNVGEWVEGGIIKGGSYNSPLSSLRVEAKEENPTSSADSFTGFRTAIRI